MEGKGEFGLLRGVGVRLGRIYRRRGLYAAGSAVRVGVRRCAREERGRGAEVPDRGVQTKFHLACACLLDFQPGETLEFL